MKVRIIEPAEQDPLDGYLFYESQAEGVGQYFLDCLYSEIDSLALFAGTHRKVFREFHWLLSKRFPYAVYCTLEDKIALVDAILDCGQNPKSIEKRLEKGTSQTD